MRRDELRKLAEQEAALQAKAVELHESAEKEQRNLSGEEQESFEKILHDIDDVRERRTRGEKLFAAQREVDQTLTTPIEKRIGDGGDAPNSFMEHRQRQLGTPQQDLPEFRAAFWQYLGVNSVSDLDVEEHRALSKGTASAGGYLVPTAFYDQIIRALRDLGSVSALANEITTDSGETIQLPANTAHGSAVWLAESAAFTPSDETFAQLTLGAYKASTKVIVSEELLQDSAFDLEAFLITEFGERLGVLENTAFIKGDGTGKPQGLLASNILSNLGADVTAAVGNSTTFNYTALVTAIFSLPRQYRANASFIVSDQAARNLYLMVDGQSRPLWSVNVAGTGPDTFLGYPIYTDPDMPPAGAGNISMVFGDWRRAYTVRRVRGFGVQRQNELHSDNGQVGFRAYERLDGRVVLAGAGIGVKHSAT
ncbi:MAG: phage major capsid protein [Chloroflexi bacterium]|nr:phage major capsid protein [Chloroflexota bacterium]